MSLPLELERARRSCHAKKSYPSEKFAKAVARDVLTKRGHGAARVRLPALRVEAPHRTGGAVNRPEYRLHVDWCVVRSDSIGDAGQSCDCGADRINTLLRALNDLVLQEGRYIRNDGKVDDVLAVVPKGALQRAREALVE